MFIQQWKNLKKSFEQNAPTSLLPPTPLMELSYGEQSLCRVLPSPDHPHEGAPMRSFCNFFIVEAKSLICSLVGAFLLLSRGIASFWGVPSLFRSSSVVNLQFSYANSASVLRSRYSWYLLTWNCLQFEFSDKGRFKSLGSQWSQERQQSSVSGVCSVPSSQLASAFWRRKIILLRMNVMRKTEIQTTYLFARWMLK